MLFTRQRLIQMAGELAEHPPDYVVIRGPQMDRPPIFDDVWSTFYMRIPLYYQLGEKVGPYEIWKRA